MKNKVLIIRLLTVFALLQMPVKNATAQTNIVAMNTTMSSKTSIVREYTGDIFLVYNYDGGVNNSFNLVDVSTGLCLTMYVPGIMANDVEIVDGTAYYCGSDGANVIAGWFDINSLFYLGGGMSTVTIPTTLPCATCTSCTERILSLDKLEIIKYNNAFNHLVMVGKATCSSSAMTNTCIAEIYNDGGDYKLAYQVEHPGVFGYDDITVLDRDVVVTGHKIGSDGEYWTSFTIPPFNSNMFITTIPLLPYPSFPNPTYGTGDAAYSPHYESELLIDNIPGNSYYATVCQAKEYTASSIVEGTYFNLYQGIPTPIYRCRIDDYHSLNYKELKYSPNTNSFFLLMEDCATNMHSGYYEFVLDNTQSYVAKVFFHQDSRLNQYVSLDRCILSTPRSQCVLTGYDYYNDFCIWKHDYINQQSCTRTFDIQHSSIQISTSQFDYQYPYETTKLTVNSYSDRIYVSVLTTICDE